MSACILKSAVLCSCGTCFISKHQTQDSYFASMKVYTCAVYIHPPSCFLWVIWQAVVQELQGLAQQLTGLQHQLQDSTLEVQRLEEEAGALDHKAVQLQLELDQAQRAHSDAQRHLQVST